MMILPSPRKPLALKLVLAFFLVAVVPILLASTVATHLVNYSVNQNIERWLNVTSHYLFVLMDETRDQMKALARLVSAQPEMNAASPWLTDEYLQGLADLEAEFVLLKDATGKVLFSSPGLEAISPEPLFPGSPFFWAEMHESPKKQIIISYQHEFTAQNSEKRTLTLGNPFYIELSQDAPEPIAVAFFLPKSGGGFTLAYSSDDENDLRLSEEAEDSIRSGANSFFIGSSYWLGFAAGNDTKTRRLVTPIRNKNGDILAVTVVSATILQPDSHLPGPQKLFAFFFICTALFSIAIGYLLARNFVTPLQDLRKAVRNVAKGDLHSKVPVIGQDELADLAEGFNSMAEELLVARSELENKARQERTRMLGEIALGFAHEIRNPLVVIKTSAEIVKKALPPNEKDARLLGFVAEEVGRIDSLLTEFLNFAKPAPPKLAPFALQALVEETLEISLASLQQKGIRCSFTAKIEDGVIQGERDQVKQVLLNLILNAMQAMPNGGTLDVTLYSWPSTICLDVQDSGTGIPEHIQDKIHMPFISTKKNSLGLGLAKVYAVMEEHGGSVHFASSPESGTVFTLCFNKG